jgi:hypothetical protein
VSGIYLINSEYCAASSSPSSPPVTFNAIIQDSWGLALTVSGFSPSARLTSVTSPLTGAYYSDTAFTD